MSRYQLILNELTQTLNQVDLKDTEQFVNSLQSEVPVFVAAKGRSAFVANSFAMRLNQLGKKSYVVGETST
ncbi:phosphoheptose isomerase family protein, partial [Mammaliicoccus sciuri]|nr:6-phospho-3-hexuloisomerase [Mammaliicoccus sciuri]